MIKNIRKEYLKEYNKEKHIAIGVLGSTDFYDRSGKSKLICTAIGNEIDRRSNFVLVTGGLFGVAHQTALGMKDKERIFNVLPKTISKPVFDHGNFIQIGNSMEDRRSHLAQMAHFYFVIEGGPGTVDEAIKVIHFNYHSALFPISITGGAANGLFFENFPKFQREVKERIVSLADCCGHELNPNNLIDICENGKFDQIENDIKFIFDQIEILAKFNFNNEKNNNDDDDQISLL